MTEATEHIHCVCVCVYIYKEIITRLCAHSAVNVP